MWLHGGAVPDRCVCNGCLQCRLPTVMGTLKMALIASDRGQTPPPPSQKWPESPRTALCVAIIAQKCPNHLRLPCVAIIGGMACGCLVGSPLARGLFAR